MGPMRVAVEGCGHGELDRIYETIEECEKRLGKRVDLLIACGDFQSIRNLSDLQTMACPDKYKDMGSFWSYFSGHKRAPVLTIFIGGNHEATNYLQELPYGGWVAPNIYYLGYAGVVRIVGRNSKRGIRVGGLSGIFKGHDYLKGHFERPPYDERTKRSAYHVRNLEVFRLKQLRLVPPTVMVSHDWPTGVWEHGDVANLLRKKPFFTDEINNGTLGSREELLCFMTMEEVTKEKLYRLRDRKLQDKKRHTRFLALDKVLPGRNFLQIIEVEEDDFIDGDHEVEIPEDLEEMTVFHDPAWLAVLRSTSHLSSSISNMTHMPGPGYEDRWDFAPTSNEVSEIWKLLDGDFRVAADSFDSEGVHCFDPEKESIRGLASAPIAEPRRNRQTQWICNKLSITDPLEEVLKREGKAFYMQETIKNTDEIDLGDSEDDMDPEEKTDEVMRDRDENFAFAEKKSLPPRTSLNLPPPKQDNTNVTDVSKELSEETPVINDVGFVEDVTPAGPSVADDPRPKKTLKRRNQALYTREDD